MISQDANGTVEQEGSSSVGMPIGSKYAHFARSGCGYYHLITGRCPASIPGAYWNSMASLKWILRAIDISIFLLVFLFFLAAVTDLRSAVRILERGGVLVIAALVAIHGILFLYGLRYTAGRFQRFLVAHNLLICLRCGYVLEQLSSCHRCPECGDPYEFQALRLSWQEWMRINVAQ
jgi:hypothetical protein